MKIVATFGIALFVSIILMTLGPAKLVPAGMAGWYMWGVAFGILAGAAGRELVSEEPLVTSLAVVRARRAYNRDVQRRAADFISLGVPHATAIERAVREKALEAQEALGL